METPLKVVSEYQNRMLLFAIFDCQFKKNTFETVRKMWKSVFEATF